MDRLDAVLGVAAPPLKRADQILRTAGAPPDHDVWPSLRRVRLLAWDAAQAVAALRPHDLATAAAELRADARSYAGIADSLPPPHGWRGAAADAYDVARQRTASSLSGGPDSLDERLTATADLADALMDWMEKTRGDLAVTLASIIGSAEAVTLSAAPAIDPVPNREVRAAADVAARVLQTVADSYDAAHELVRRSAGLTTAAPG